MDEENNPFTKQELERMKEYEKITRERIIYTSSERIQIYKKYDLVTLENARNGIQRAIYARLNLDNEFDNLDDGWKLKTLKLNLEAITTILNGRSDKAKLK